MHRSSRAPVLSATRRRDSCWITSRPPRSPAGASASCRESGRVSTMRTTSPSFAWFSSSCAWRPSSRLTTFLYRGCTFTTSTRTTIVLSALADTTVPWRSWRRPRSCSGFGRRVIGFRSAACRASASSSFGRSERVAGASSSASAQGRCRSGGLGGASSAGPRGAPPRRQALGRRLFGGRPRPPQPSAPAPRLAGSRRSGSGLGVGLLGCGLLGQGSASALPRLGSASAPASAPRLVVDLGFGRGSTASGTAPRRLGVSSVSLMFSVSSGMCSFLVRARAGRSGCGRSPAWHGAGARCSRARRSQSGNGG